MTAIIPPAGPLPASLAHQRSATGRSTGSPTGPSNASRAAVPLTDRPREATPPEPTLAYHPQQPPMSPEPGCVIHAQISEKDSDAGQFFLCRGGEPMCGRERRPSAE